MLFGFITSEILENSVYFFYTIIIYIDFSNKKYENIFFFKKLFSYIFEQHLVAIHLLTAFTFEKTPIYKILELNQSSHYIDKTQQAPIKVSFTPSWRGQFIRYLGRGKIRTTHTGAAARCISTAILLTYLAARGAHLQFKFPAPRAKVPGPASALEPLLLPLIKMAYARESKYIVGASRGIRAKYS